MFFKPIFFILSLVFLTSCGKDSSSDLQDEPEIAETTYTITFNATWDATTHPSQDFPDDPHFSPMVGLVHQTPNQLFELGSFASPGIKLMAETGNPTTLISEGEDLINKKTAHHVFRAGAAFDSPGQDEVTIKVHKDFSLVSVTSMIAPSPDWFVAAMNVDLIEKGQWLETKVVELFPYDAGTDNGTSFASPDSITSPPADITKISSDLFQPDVPLGTFTFTLQK